MRVLAAIPCYNEELTIGSVMLKAGKYAGEVLVVDDGSSDGTAAVVKAAIDFSIGSEMIIEVRESYSYR